jgi:hypothetical protein
VEVYNFTFDPEVPEGYGPAIPRNSTDRLRHRLFPPPLRILPIGLTYPIKRNAKHRPDLALGQEV